MVGLREYSVWWMWQQLREFLGGPEWKTHPCGCRSRAPAFTPIELERCPACQKAHEEWSAKQPPEPPRDDADTNCYFIA